MKEKIRKFIETSFLVTFSNELTDQTNLFEANVIDSYGLIELIAYLESELGVKLTEDEMVSHELVSLNGIAELASRKLAADKEG